MEYSTNTKVTIKITLSSIGLMKSERDIFATLAHFNYLCCGIVRVLANQQVVNSLLNEKLPTRSSRINLQETRPHRTIGCFNVCSFMRLHYRKEFHIFSSIRKEMNKRKRRGRDGEKADNSLNFTYISRYAYGLIGTILIVLLSKTLIYKKKYFNPHFSKVLSPFS